MGIDLVVNRRARACERDPGLLGAIRDTVRGRGRLHVTDAPEDLREVAAELARRGTELVLLCGGDGTLMAGVTALCERFPEDAFPRISPIPSGTAGTIARNWGISGHPLHCLRRALELTRRIVPRPTLRVVEHALAPTATQRTANQPTATQRTRVGFIVGTGLVAKFFRVYYERGAPGYRGSARLVARIFAESFIGGPLARHILEPLPCRLTADGQLLPPEAWSLVCCSVVPNLGIHMLVNHRAAEDFQRPHLVATPMRPHELGPRAPWVLAGKPFGGPGHVDRLVERFEIRFPSPSDPSPSDPSPSDPSSSDPSSSDLSPGGGPYVLDGELLEAPGVTVSAGPVIPIAIPTG